MKTTDLGFPFDESTRDLLSPDRQRDLDAIRGLNGRTFEVDDVCVARIEVHSYRNGRLAIALVDVLDREPLATLTVNIPEEAVKDGEIIVKAYSENEEVAEAALRSPYFKDTGRRISLGFVEASVWAVTEASTWPKVKEFPELSEMLGKRVYDDRAGDDPWRDNSIQFPRLLAEIKAVGLTPEQMNGLCDSMNLDREQIHELLDRAEEVFEGLKEKL